MDIYQPSTSNTSFYVNNRFHVFLSFRGADVRKTYVEHLYAALSAAGLRVFLDSEELEKGKAIDSSLQSAIETSDILIPIFSKGYAESTWCLEEAARMCRSNGLIVPLFYDVQPCDVRYPERSGGAFAQAFQKHRSHLERQDENTIEEWKRALHQISCLSGWCRHDEFGHEGRLVKDVVNDVLHILKKRVPLDVPTHLVGLDSSIQKVINNLHLNSTDRSLVTTAICGISGIGKTTLAKAVYNEIHSGFDASCFLFSISAALAQNKTTLMDFQGQLLRRLVNYGGEVSSVYEGRSLMRDRLRGLRALVIFDDVNDRDQLLQLYGDWFGHGSRVIITSRDQHILNLAKADSVFKMCGLSEDEALELFSWHAFLKAFPQSTYRELSTKIVKACRGHPLSLELIGAQLYDKKEPNDNQCWEEAVHNIGDNPGVSKILQASYDGLSHVEKKMFLDIACYFVGESKRDADLFWEVLYPNKVQTATKNLLLKMLINLNGSQNLLDMHDLLREMGRGIQERGDDNRRLCLPMGPNRTLNRYEAEQVNMLLYKGEMGRESVHCMPSLHYLSLRNAKVVGNIGKLAPNLIWIKIRSCEFLSNTHTWLMSRNGLQLDSSWSQVRILSLEECSGLRKIPNTLDSLVNLQCLYIQNCKALSTLPSTVGNLPQLKRLKLCGCENLASLPETVGDLVGLKELYLDGCADLKSLPSAIGNLAQLRVLSLQGCTGLKTLPNSTGDLAQLKVLNLHDCSGLQRFPYTVSKLRKLRMLNIHGCSGLGSFLEIVVKLAQIRDLNRSAGLESLVQEEFNVYLGFSASEVGETLTVHRNKFFRIYRGEEDNQILRSESLRICRGREGDQWRDIRRAIDSSDILLPVFSKGFANSDRSLGEAAVMCRSNGLIIPFFYDVEPHYVQHPEAEGSPYAWVFKELYTNISDEKSALGTSVWE